MPFRKKGSKNWHYDFQFKGRRFYGSCETDNFQDAKLVEAEARTAAKIAQRPRTDYTLSEAIGTYYTDICQHQPSASTSYSQGKMVLADIDGGIFIGDLDNGDLMAFVAKSRATQSNGYVNRKVEFLSRAIRHMGKFYKARLPDLDYAAVRTKEPQEVVRELTKDEERRLFKHLRPDLHFMVRFALMTGARQKAIFNLRWSDIGDTHLTLAGEHNGKPPYKFRISRPLRAFLTSLPKSNVLAHRDFVFTWIDRHGNRRPFNQNNHWMWDRAFVAAEIENFRFHDFRHTFATRMLRHTGNLKLVSRLLGHRSIDTTVKYAHVLDADFEDALEGFYNLTPAEIPAASGKSE
ncbi:site-specific integrase [uncultured Tateyamaria sp.]|uniref:tyrosine-type recombinase/integrase n=1 Tax=Tateyamaria sp. 1078 TaxID=3417464 RepID=UPI00261D2852|nr:site-specific integrase [uncultured Tateyamaria sp.]